VGEPASIDERGRITIPVEIRKTIGEKEFKLQLLDKDTIILKAVKSDQVLDNIRK
jgi:bifunctional DNA-binding transcriptional regulator/antitoxin component of YhaV-PrlF toxin-antitoxin module